jgi:hypothetical protein
MIKITRFSKQKSLKEHVVNFGVRVEAYFSFGNNAFADYNSEAFGINHCMLKQFIRQCLLFGSRESFHKFLGMLGWACIFLFVYAVVNLVKLS